MLFRTHFVFSFFIFLISFREANDLFSFSLFFLFSILFVDVDSKESKMGKLLIFRFFQFFLKHRGIFHSLFFCVIFSFLFYVFVGESAAFGFFVGFSSHLILDCLTLEGIMLFWPFSRKRIRGFFKTDGFFEIILFLFFLLVDIILVGNLLQKCYFGEYKCL